NKCQHQTDSDNPPPVLTQSLLSLPLQLFSTPHPFHRRFPIPLSSEAALLLCALLPVPSAHNRCFALHCPAYTAYGSVFLQYYEHIHTLFRNLALSSVLLAHFSIPAAPALRVFLSHPACRTHTPGTGHWILAPLPDIQLHGSDVHRTPSFQENGTPDILQPPPAAPSYQPSSHPRLK